MAEFPVCGDLLDLDSIKDEDLFGTIDESPIGSTSLLSFDDIGKPALPVANVQTFLPLQGTRTPGGRKIVFSDKENQSPDSPAFRYTEKPALSASVLKRKFETIIGSSYMTTTGLHGRSGLRDHTNLLSPIRPIGAEVTRCASFSLSPITDIELSTSPLVAIQPPTSRLQPIDTHDMQEPGTSQALECPTPVYTSTVATVSMPSCPSLSAVSASAVSVSASAASAASAVSVLDSREVTATTISMAHAEALKPQQKSIVDTIFEMDDEEQLSSLQPSCIISQPPASNIPAPAAPATATTVTQPPPALQNISRLKAPSSVSIKRLLSPNRSVRQTIRRVDSNMSDQEEPTKRIKLDSTSVVAGPGAISKSSAIPIPSRLRPFSSHTK